MGKKRNRINENFKSLVETPSHEKAAGLLTASRPNNIIYDDTSFTFTFQSFVHSARVSVAVVYTENI